MITYIFLISIFIILLSPFLLVGYILETREEKKRAKLRDQIAKQSR